MVISARCLWVVTLYRWLSTGLCERHPRVPWTLGAVGNRQNVVRRGLSTEFSDRAVSHHRIQPESTIPGEPGCTPNDGALAMPTSCKSHGPISRGWAAVSSQRIRHQHRG